MLLYALFDILLATDDAFEIVLECWGMRAGGAGWFCERINWGWTYVPEVSLLICEKITFVIAAGVVWGWAR